MGEASFRQSSSGTTGIQRAVLVHDGAVLARLDACSAALERGADDVLARRLLKSSSGKLARREDQARHAHVPEGPV